MDSAPYSNTTTSLEAAVNLDPDKRISTRQKVFDFIRSQGDHGATRQEIEKATGIDGNTVRPRLSDLFKERSIAVASFRRKTTSGRNAQVLVALK